MGALRLAFGMFFSVIALLGYMAFDYTMANRSITAGGGEPMSFFTYVKGWTGLAGLLADRGESAAGAPLPEALAAMLPKPPPGWTVRPAEEADAQAFLAAGLTDKDRALVLSAVTPNPGRGVERAAQTYQDGPRLVVVELVRYPNLIFTSFAAMAQKMQLQMASLDIPAQDFMIVRGLEIREVRLAGDAPARVFLADVGAQIHLRVLAPKTMTDLELLPLFETLNVPAMNADVVERVAGLGEVPVIVLASVITEETRKARGDELAAARAAAEAAKTEAAAADEEAGAGTATGNDEPAPEAEKAAPEAAPNDTPAEEDEIKLHKGLGKENKGSTLKTEGKSALGSGECRTEGGRKVCGVLGP